MIKELPTEERPRERCLTYGPECLSLRECLAAILGSGPQSVGSLGVAENLLLGDDEETFFRRLEEFGNVSTEKVRGLGPAGKVRILIVMEIAKRYLRYKQKDLGQHEPINNELPKSVFKKIPDEIKFGDLEHIGFVPYYRDETIGNFQLIAIGERSTAIFNQQKLMRSLIYLGAMGFWLIHNHPGGSTEASQHDKEVTRKVQTLSRILGVHFFGHWVVAGERVTKI